MPMDRNRWLQIEDLFHRALELEGEPREQLLAAAGAADAALREQVQQLLRASGSAVPLLDTGAEPLFALLDENADDDVPLPDGGLVGGYRILEPIGRGGMAAVYLAERVAGGVRQRVALKVVKRGTDTDEVLRRFRQERQVLASLEHPNIARFYDAGVTADGRPYLAMEYVDGVPLTTFCDERRLDVGARLRLFHTVCGAVQYAQQKLVVHRDIKPSNILVTAEGEPRLLDFGIAKLLAEDVLEDAAVTRTGVHALTPGYAAPEQLLGGPITMATDVYGLGIVLYELLAGRRPAAAERSVITAAGSAAAREYVAPSVAAVRTLSAQRTDAVAAARATTPARLRRRLQGDLDTIVGKALEADPELRYSGAQALADDIRRTLSGLPIQARPHGAWYRGSRFVRRHWRGVTVAAALTLLLAAFSTSTALQQRETERARRTAELERETAETVAQFLENLFAAANPYAASGERLDTFRVASLLRRGAERARAELADQPEIQVRLLRVLGRSYRFMRDTDAAAPLIEESAARARALYGPDRLELAESIDELANLRVAQARITDAEPLFRECYEITRRAVGDEHPATIRSLARLGSFLVRRSRPAEADSLIADALERARALPEPDSTLLADILTQRGLAASTRGDHDSGIDAAREALAINRLRFGAGHPRSIGDLNNLALYFQRAGRHDEAEAAYRDAVALQKQALGPTHPNVALLMTVHASALGRVGRHDEAHQVYEEAVAIARTLAPHTAAMILRFYAAFLRSRGELAQAERAYREAIALPASTAGDRDYQVALAQSGLAGLLCANGRPQDGAALYVQALATFKRLLPPEHRDVTQTTTALAGCRR